MKTTEENNKMIAEFMGAKLFLEYWRVQENGEYTVEEPLAALLIMKSINELEFHSSWEWLMPVVEKIESIDDGKFDVSLLQDGVIISEWKKQNEIVRLTLAEVDLGSRKNFTYHAVIQFIEYYNKNN